LWAKEEPMKPIRIPALAPERLAAVLEDLRGYRERSACRTTLT
jgi:hypothetical protein